MKSKAILALLALSCCALVDADYQIGVGRADCTGPAAEIIFMGYAKLSQVGCGLHLRQFSRAFIVDDGENRAVFVSIDSLTMNHGVRRQVLKNLAALYNDTYTEKNLVLSGTHSHSTPGGFLMDLMLDIPCLGFVQESFDSLVDGITQSIINAHESMVEGKIFLTSGTLLDANINRSPASYLYNPEEERAKYDYDVDKEMVQLKFVRSSDNQPIGAINWFAVHPTSMNNTNCLVSSDNVGYASIQLEAYLNNGALPGTGEFVGAFASSNLGDVSPNTKGPICIDTGEECDFVTSTCNGEAKTCIAFGPGDNMVESTSIIAGKLLDKAKELFDQAEPEEVTGPVKYIHQYVDMPNEKATITLANGTEQEIQGCPPAMGYSFAGGTTDGPGEFDFAQGTITDNPFWDAVRNFVFPPTEEEIACHAPKPILVNTGGVDFPYSWQARIVTTQILLFGQVALIAVPGEFTTMSGRRLREAVQDTIISNGGPENTKPVLTGHSNVYTNYIATPEEYQLQRYEGGSTIYGPQTLNLYINKFKQLAAAMVKGETLDPGPTPHDFSSQLITLVFPAAADGTAEGQNFGDCLQQPAESVSSGDTVVVKFAGGNPRHNSLLGSSYISVEKATGDDWVVVATDANWETRYLWKRTNSDTGENEVTIEWDVGETVEPGEYRIRHNGHYKTESGAINPYEGVTQSFTVA
jgi:neutral ceramidase